VDPW
jgi:hypothetical protein